MNRHTHPAAYRTVAGTLERRCNGCNQWFPFDHTNFHANRANKSGLVSQCKACLCAATIARNHARQVPRIGPRNVDGPEPVYWSRYAARRARRASGAIS